METWFSSLRASVANRSSAQSDLAEAYGNVGRLLMAANFFDSAEICFLNAQALSATQGRWPYYLGHLYKAKGPVEKSVEFFSRALQLMPDDVATLIWLGEANLSAGRADAAATVFARAMAKVIVFTGFNLS